MFSYGRLTVGAGVTAAVLCAASLVVPVQAADKKVDRIHFLIPGGAGGGARPAYMPSFSFRLDSVTGKRKDLQVKVKRMEEEDIEKVVDVEETEIK